MKAIGLDIGTTTICGVVLDGENGEVLFSRTLPNNTAMQEGASYEKKQDPEKIWNRIRQILEEMAQQHPDAESIGLTGQMHGILYVNQDGEAVSPLYTWQDESGNLVLHEENGTEEELQEKDCGQPEITGTVCRRGTGKTYVEALEEETGYFAATGFGLTTCYYQQKNGRIPETAAHLCTIGDYIVMKLTDSRVPVISPSNAASLGIFDLEKGEFDTAAVRKIGIDPALLPEVVQGAVKAGCVTEKAAPVVQGRPVYAGIPVSVALGDNQASVIGTVKDIENTILVNVGTGSQISVGTGKYVPDTAVELRPLTDGKYIFVGACLCGGRAYAVLENFFRQVAQMAGAPCGEKLYGKMAQLLAETESDAGSRVKVNPQFCGTRMQPELRGSVTEIGLDNLTPQSMIRGFLYGIAGELHDMYCQIRPQLEYAPKYLVGSGNGIRMNPVLQKIFEELFGAKLQIPVHTEEAAYGTALFSLVAAGCYETLEQAQKVIRYQSE